MRSIPVICLLFVLMVSCSKDKFETKPRIEIDSYESKDVYQGGSLNIDLRYFDKEGDLGGAMFTFIRIRQNQLELGSGQGSPDTVTVAIPEFPNKQEGIINFNIGYDFAKESLIENDSLVFKFSVMDNAGNASDTITSDQVVIHLP